MFKLLTALVFAFIAFPFAGFAQQLDDSQCDSKASPIDDMFQGSFCMKMKRGIFHVRIPATMTAEIGGETHNYVAWAPVVPLNSRPRHNPGHCYWQRADPNDPLSFMGDLVDMVMLRCSFTENNDGKIKRKKSATLSVTYAKMEGEVLKEMLVSLIINVNGKSLSPALFRSNTPGKACLPPGCKSEVRVLDIPNPDVLDDIVLMDFTYAFDLLDSEDDDFGPVPAVLHVKGFASKWRR